MDFGLFKNTLDVKGHLHRNGIFKVDEFCQTTSRRDVTDRNVVNGVHTSIPFYMFLNIRVLSCYDGPTE